MTLDEALKKIPPGCVFVNQGEHPISKIIGWWYIITHLSWAIKNRFKLLGSHAGIYLGGGDHTIIETVPYKILGKLPWGRVDARKFEKTNLGNKDLAWVYVNTNMTVMQLQMLKSFCYGSIGRLYDIFAVLHFVIPSIPEEPSFVMCSEFAVESMRHAEQIIVPNFHPSKVHPTELHKWLDSDEAKKLGWKKVFYWNKGEVTIYE